MNQSFLKSAYSQESIEEFLNSFLPDFQQDIRPLNTSNSKHITSARKLGESPELELAIYEVDHDKSNEKRVGLALEGFRLMKNTGVYNALIIFKSNTANSWRLSLMTTTQELRTGKVVNTFSNPRRYSYILGEDTKTTTPYKFLIHKGTVKDFEDLLSRFSVEVVNNEFYKEVAKLYDELVGTENVSGVLKYPNGGEASHQFAVRLIGRIVFCWFLREKHSPNEIPLVSKSVLSREASNSSDYYHTVLAPLFFQVLNEPIHKRSEKFKTGEFGKIPYLNGGLFAPQDDDYYKFDELLEQSVPGIVGVPDKWIHKLLDLLELYHFTVDENTSVDIDLSIDPEMLGRIFENLLARINPETGETVRKATGSFYTPREVVEFMVDQTLVEYLASSTKIDRDHLKALVSFNLDDDSDYPIDDSQKLEVVRALNSIRILDPACGSGAFPIGVLQKVVFILQQIDPEAKVWFENQIANTSPEVRHLIEREFEHKNFDYIRKLGVIRESIFGVDIQPIATEIARLRCFLTLIVDERVDDNEPNRGVYPLPNLDFKFVTANTLIKLGEISAPNSDQTGLFEDESGINELKRLRDAYFNSHNSERDALKFKFSQAQNKMLQNIINTHMKGLAETTQKLSSWDPFSNQSTNWFDPEWMFGISDGFDVVIGNPPYYIENDDRTRFDGLRNLECYQGKMNVWYLFGGFGLDVIKPNGLLCFIATNNWTTNAGASKWRNKVIKSARILSLLDFGSYMVFESASQQTMVTLMRRSTEDNYRFDYRRIIAKKPTRTDFLDLLIKSTGENNQYIEPEIQRTAFINKLLTFSDEASEPILKKISSNGLIKLTSKEVAQGIVFPQDYLNKKSASKLGSPHKIGDGVFVVNDSVKDSLQLSATETELLKPYYTTKQLGRYSAERKNNEWVIYTDSHYKNRDSLNGYPSIKSHLDTYSSIITSANKPYGLHRAREEKFFLGEKIVSLRKSPSRPSFTYVDFDCYVSATFFVIKTSRMNLKYLTGLLNSKLIAFWLKNKGKMQGHNYQVDKDPILDIPLIIAPEAVQEKISQWVSEIYEDKGNIAPNEKLIDNVVYDLYGINEDEIEFIENVIT